MSLTGRLFTLLVVIENYKPDRCLNIDAFTLKQTTHLGSPALDLQFYLLSVLDSKVRRYELSNLLHFYYDSFNKYASQLGQESVFTFEVSNDVKLTWSQTLIFDKNALVRRLLKKISGANAILDLYLACTAYLVWKP